MDKLRKDEYKDHHMHVPHYPFQDEGEWELAKFLTTHLTQTEITHFLKLKWFLTRPKPSFTSAQQLCGWMDNLPSGPEWQCTTVTLQGCPTTRPIHLIWRNAKAVVEDILSNLVFANYMTFDPHIVMEYSEFFMADRAHEIQDHLPDGATLVPIIIAFDKTPVTRHTGGLEMHPIFVTIGNIQSDIRMQATSHAWHCVGFMPVPDFDVHPDFQTILSARLFHSCMDTIFTSLKHAAQHGAPMTDALGYVRNCFTPLVTYIADLPEQQLVACVAKNSSPVTTATLSQFGDTFPHPPRSGANTLRQIQELCAVVHPWDITNFQKRAKAIKLLGVHLPFWRDWKHADPACFLNGEMLHSCHKFFFDHPLKWCKEIARHHVLDTCYKTQHKHIGVRHFTSGISHVKQMTGCDHHDIQRTIVPMVAKSSPTVTPLFVYTIRSLIEFIYKAQNPVHTDASIASMVDALAEFHLNRQSIINAGARRGTSGVKTDFNIPKLEVMQSFARNIKDNGTLMQYTADVTEHLLITHCKHLFERTSWQANTFVDQIITLLNHEENIRCFDLYLLLHKSTQPLENLIVVEDEEVSTINPLFSFMTCILPDEELSFSGPRHFHNFFTDPKGFLSSSGAVAFHVTVKPDHVGITVTQMEDLYPFPHATQYINHYIHIASSGDLTYLWSPSLGRFNVWHKCRIQQHLSFQSRYLMRSQVIQAHPHSEEHPFGVHDAVLLSCPDTDNMTNVARVKAIFAPKVHTHVELPSYLESPLAFVEYFTVCADPMADREGVGLYRVQHPPINNIAAGPSSYYVVVPLTDIVHAVELVPVFETSITGINPSKESYLKAYEQYYVNSFADKESFNVMC
ncbi:hypothetical protein EDD16DRAFT_1746620 [Pisolithus croceorrhizus]|nr:hypothetical protein EDD16DRAFT_1746620 [Pisolithus croceorrhizus]KAI6150147.1 hypothetical protein EDD17DRAFT_1739703 [Pisolithus thermaeus]